MKILNTGLNQALSFQKKRYQVTERAANGCYMHDCSYCDTFKKVSNEGKVGLYGNQKPCMEEFGNDAFMNKVYCVVELDESETISQCDIDNNAIVIAPINEAARFISQNAETKFFIEYGDSLFGDRKVLDFDNPDQYDECLDARNIVFKESAFKLRCKRRKLDLLKIDLLDAKKEILQIENKKLDAEEKEYIEETIAKKEAEISKLKTLIEEKSLELQKLENIAEKSISDLTPQKAYKNIIVPQISKAEYWFGYYGSLVKY